MASKIWENAEVIWDTDSDPTNPGWVIKVDEIEADGYHQPMTYAPAPAVYHEPSDADKGEILAQTAQWEGAMVR